jgi:hypothetical protein
LEHISKLTGQIDLTTDPRIAFVVTGGGNLKHWVNKQYLRGLELPEIHYYDRDNDYGYADQIAAVIARGGQNWGALTVKREIENYLHPTAVLAATNIQIAINDEDDIPLLFARAQHAASPDAKPWSEIDPDDERKKCSKAKKRLCCESASKMTLDLLLERDPGQEISTLLRKIAEIVEAE